MLNPKRILKNIWIVYMNTKDLMIGDLINLNFDVDCNTGEPIYVSAQVTGINKDGTVDVNFIYDKSELMHNGWDSKLIEPIELTEEVLEKIGFKKRPPRFGDKEYEMSNFLLRSWSDGKMFKLHCYDWSSGEFVFPNTIKYVHELQHLIKICDKNCDFDL